MISQVEKVEELLTQVQKTLVKAVQEAYPAGTVVQAKLAGHTVDLQVTKVRDCYWSQPGLIMGKNLRTGKTRSFFDKDVIAILSTPALQHEGENCA